MPTGTVKFFDPDRGFGFVVPDDGSGDIFFHESALAIGDEVSTGKAVRFQTGVDKKTGKVRATSVDLL